MLKAVYALAAAAIVAGAFVATLSISAQVEARGSVPGIKTDPADTRPLAPELFAKRPAVFRGLLPPRHAKAVRSGAWRTDRVGEFGSIMRVEVLSFRAGNLSYCACLPGCRYQRE